MKNPTLSTLVDECTVNGCTRPPRSRKSGICEAHYYRLRRNGTLSLKLACLDEPVSSRCQHCGEHNDPAAVVARKWCSPRCAARGRRGRSAEARQCETCSTAIPATARADKRYCDPCLRRRMTDTSHKIRKTKRAEARAVRLAAELTLTCEWCGLQFTHHRNKSFCSRACVAALVQQRRRIRKKSAAHIPVVPARIYERDEWICQLCFAAVRRTAKVPHPLAPTVDHRIPLVWGGVDSPDATQTAHFLCNSRKGSLLLW